MSDHLFAFSWKRQKDSGADIEIIIRMDPCLTWDDGTEVVDSERLDPSAIRDIFDIQNLFEMMRLSMAKSTLSKGKYSIYKIFL
ncbi:MAG: hypothetical protein PUF78_06365, partial [Lachnospiraceae bacterium]|nr:hypothetical protein [Lachnospiraceae bacterium]